MSRGANKERFLNIRVTESMYLELKKYAERELMTVSSAARRAMLLEIRRHALAQKDQKTSMKAIRDQQEQALLDEIAQENRRSGGISQNIPDELPI